MHQPGHRGGDAEAGDVADGVAAPSRSRKGAAAKSMIEETAVAASAPPMIASASKPLSARLTDTPAPGQARDLDDAHAPEVEPPPQHRARDGADAGEQEHGRGELEQPGGARAEDRTGDGRASTNVSRESSKPRPRLMRIAASRWASVIVGALDERRGAALEGQDHGERDERQRDRGAAELGRRDEARQRDGGGEGQHLAGGAGDEHPADAGERGVLEGGRRASGKLGVRSVGGRLQGSSAPPTEPRARRLAERKAARRRSVSLVMGTDVVFALFQTSWSGALERGL